MKARRFLALLLTCVLVFQFIPSYALADDAISGTCGDNLTWSFDEATGLLTISGTGEMQNYGLPIDVPWIKDFQSLIASVVIEKGVTSISQYAFDGCTILTSVTIPDSITIIDERTFAG